MLETLTDQAVTVENEKGLIVYGDEKSENIQMSSELHLIPSGKYSFLPSQMKYIISGTMSLKLNCIFL